MRTPSLDPRRAERVGVLVVERERAAGGGRRDAAEPEAEQDAGLDPGVGAPRPSAPRSAARTAPVLRAALSCDEGRERRGSSGRGAARSGRAPPECLGRRQRTWTPAVASAARSAAAWAGRPAPAAAGARRRSGPSGPAPPSPARDWSRGSWRPSAAGGGTGTRGRLRARPRAGGRTRAVICAGHLVGRHRDQPSPPAAATGNASQSSPESTAKPAGRRRRSSMICRRSPLASLIPSRSDARPAEARWPGAD